jgi:hypothetical protein
VPTSAAHDLLLSKTNTRVSHRHPTLQPERVSVHDETPASVRSSSCSPVVRRSSRSKSGSSDIPSSLEHRLFTSAFANRDRFHRASRDGSARLPRPRIPFIEIPRRPSPGRDPGTRTRALARAQPRDTAVRIGARPATLEPPRPTGVTPSFATLRQRPRLLLPCDPRTDPRAVVLFAETPLFFLRLFAGEGLDIERSLAALHNESGRRSRRSGCPLVAEEDRARPTLSPHAGCRHAGSYPRRILWIGATDMTEIPTRCSLRRLPRAETRHLPSGSDFGAGLSSARLPSACAHARAAGVRLWFPETTPGR